MSKKNIYLDYAAASPVDKRVMSVMEPYFSEKFHNPSSTYGPAREAKAAVEYSRKTVARFLGAKPSEVVFTAGGTESNNLAIIGTAHRHPGGHIVTTAIEHDSVLKPIEYLAGKGWQTTIVKPKNDGVIDEKKILATVTDETILLSVMQANNEVGTIQPIRKIAEGLKEIRRNRQKRGIDKPVYLHTDACQATNYLDMHVNRLGVDLLTFNSDKIHGPKQCGALFISTGTLIDPIIIGGNQERGLRNGTQNVPSVVGFAEALKIAEEIKEKETKRIKKLQYYFYEQLTKIKGCQINGSMKKRLPNNLHVTLAGIDNERVLFQLEEKGILAATGAACSASSEEPSHVLRSMGLSDDLIRGSIRFSFGRDTSREDLLYVAETLKQLVA